MEKKLLILQWGKARSIVVSLGNGKVFILDNQYLMNLDEMGIVL